MNSKDPESIALAFNECITRHDVDGLARLMTDDHTFIDRDNTIHRPKDFMIESWKKFFEMFPLYKNTFTRIAAKGNLVAMLGYGYWSEEQPHDNAIWVATIVDNRVAEWRIYHDTEESRKAFNLLER
jgi:predicted SnoaL-like aldol condensation-catalyzing enzyme